MGGTEYDTTKIRELARRIGQVSEQVTDARTGTINAARRELPENFSGRAADALTEALNEWSGDVGRVGSALASLKGALYELARRLDEADRQAQQLIKQR